MGTRYISYHTKLSVNVIDAFVDQCHQYILYCMGAIFLGMLNIHTLFFDPILVKLRDRTSAIIPSEISQARYTFLIFSCIIVPTGWFLSNVFLYLYFKDDEGYFSVAQLEFRFSGDNVGKDPERCEHLCGIKPDDESTTERENAV